MSHLIVKPYDTVYCPEGEFAQTWHGLQTVVKGKILPDGSNIPNVLFPVVSAGFKVDFESEMTEMPAELSAEMASNPLTEWKMILADRRAQGLGITPLHVAKSGYTIHQNKRVYDSAIGCCNAVFGNGYSVATAATLGAGSQFMLSIHIGELGEFNIGNGDKHQQFFNIVSSHNGLVASCIMLSIIRMVCFNTLIMSVTRALENGTYAKHKHSKHSLDLITPERFEAELRKWIKESKRTQELLSYFNSQKMSLDQFRFFSAGVFTNDGSDSLSTNSFNRISELETLFSRGKGNKGETLFDGFNAITEYFTHNLGKNSSPEKRIASANFGRGNEWKLQAMECAKPENFGKVLERGEMLYTDKVKEMSAAN